jgi:arylsulfatase A-like enzyme/cytochrome c-type biogenesis protein CcmH/NrfG
VRKLLIGLAILGIVGAAAAWWLRPTAPPSVLLVTIDTLRADRLGSYGYAAAQTPVLDALASRGARFARASTVVPLTLPAHASLLTGTWPAYHGVRDNGGFYLEPDHVTVAEALKARGYRTGGFVAAFVLDGRWGIGQGFDLFFDDFDLSKADQPGMDAIQRRGSEVVDRALAWLAEDSPAPFFAWVHLYDPHTPYEAPRDVRARFPRTMSGAYDAEIAYTDAQLGRLFGALDAEGRLDDTLVVVVGDHGESLGEHKEQTHGFFIYEATTHVPLIMAGPRVPVRVIDDQVRIVDVMPTILSLVGAGTSAAIQGEDLSPALTGARLELLAYSESFYPRYHYGWSELKAVSDGRYKFILAPTRELYDHQVDPRETRNLAAESPGRADALQRALTDLVARSARAEAARGPQRIDPEVEERLRALGYVSASVTASALDDRPRGDPKDKIELYNLLKLAGTDSIEKRVDEAIAKVRRALAADSEIVEAHTMLGNLSVKAGRLSEAAAAYQQALAIDPENHGAIFSLAITYKSMGRLEDAEAGFERLRTLDARDSRAAFQLADIRMRRRDFAGAETLLKEALEAGTERAPLLVKLAQCYIETSRGPEGEELLRAALAERPDVADAHFALGILHENNRQPRAAVAEYEAELAVNPKNHAASFNVAKLLAAAGRRAEALARFREAVASNPQFGTGFLYLAQALLEDGDLTGAEEAARQGLRFEPDPNIAPLGHYVLADVYNRLGRPADAGRHVALARQLEGKARP